MRALLIYLMQGMSFGYECHCAAGYTGTNCQQTIVTDALLSDRNTSNNNTGAAIA